MICLFMKPQRLCSSFMAHLVLQLAHWLGSSMWPRSQPTKASCLHDSHWNTAILQPHPGVQVTPFSKHLIKDTHLHPRVAHTSILTGLRSLGECWRALEVRNDGAGARDHAADADELVDVAGVQIPDDLRFWQVERLCLQPTHIRTSVSISLHHSINMVWLLFTLQYCCVR